MYGAPATQKGSTNLFGDITRPTPPVPIPPAAAPTGLILSDDQQTAYNDISRFILSKDERVFVLKGYSGTGKSTLVQTLLEDIPKLLKTLQLITPHRPNQDAAEEEKNTWKTVLTATTNKAAEALAGITGEEVRTIQSFLGLRVHKDYRTGKTELRVRGGVDKPRRTVIVIDEASFIDRELLQLIFDRIDECKLLFIGDPAQILGVGCTKAPVFSAGFATAELTKVVRQAEGNPIIDLSAAFRNTVNNGEFFSFKPDGKVIRHLPAAEFEAEVIREFSRPNWHHNDSKVLAWTNKAVIRYNHGIRQVVQGEPQLQVGDYAICNSYMPDSKYAIKTDQLVQITAMDPGDSWNFGGYWVEINKYRRVFMPESLAERKRAIKEANQPDHQGNPNSAMLQAIDNTWIDLRAAYACTINKSQGSTYDRVFIDLDDVRKCNSGDQIARMLYVAVSRARHQVTFTGDLV